MWFSFETNLERIDTIPLISLKFSFSSILLSMYEIIYKLVLRKKDSTVIILSRLYQYFVAY